MPAASLQPGASPAGADSIEIPIDRVQPNPHQPRREFKEESLRELSDSIKSTGLVQPIVVREVEGGFQLIAGERRLRAAKLAGLDTIPALIRNVDSYTQAQMALVENIQRENLNPLDRAEAYRVLMDQLGLTQSELARRLGEDRSTIANFVRLLDLSDSVRQLIRSEQLSLGHAKLLAGVSDSVEQERLARLVVAQGLSVRNLERLLADGAKSDTARRASGASAHLQDLERSLSAQLGLRVQVRSTKSGRGRLTIHYGSLDQFDGLVERLGVTLE